MIKLKVINSKEYENVKKQKNFELSYAFHKSPFGKCLIAVNKNYICHLSFVTVSNFENINALKQQWPGAVLVHEIDNTKKTVKKIFHKENELFEVMLRGTSFETRVWKALLNIQKSKTCSYEDIAKSIGHQKAVRAVANAVAKNSVAYLIPCHRVIRKDGNVHKYKWGADVKMKILQFENACF